jgi:hypothetical protein
MGTEGEQGSGHPNDPTVVRQQLAQNRLTLTPEERAALIASIDRQIAEIDARNTKG